MTRPLAPAQYSIPKLFHQSWSSTELPARFQKWSDGCRDRHPDWEWVLWTDEDNEEMIRRFFPWMLQSYLSLKGPIYRADISRNAYMLLFGGAYADLDTDCLQPIEESVFDEWNVPSIPHLQSLAASDPPDSGDQANNRTAFVGRMGTDLNFEHSIPNAWMASPPAHPFFFLNLEWTRASIVTVGVNRTRDFLTGPIALHRAVGEYRKPKYHKESYGDAFPKSRYEHTLERLALPTPHDLVVLPPYYVYPYSWSRDGNGVRAVCSLELEWFNETRCKELLAVDRWPSTSITYWSHSWTQTGHSAERMKRLSADQ